jgi:SAM-dependent methyltransferase
MREDQKLINQEKLTKNPIHLLDQLIGYITQNYTIEGNVLVLGATYPEIERLDLPGINPIGLSDEIEKYRGKGVYSDFNHTLPFLNESIDLVLSSNILEFVRNQEMFFDEINRVLKKGCYSFHIDLVFQKLDTSIYCPFAKKMTELYYKSMDEELSLSYKGKFKQLEFSRQINHGILLLQKK